MSIKRTIVSSIKGTKEEIDTIKNAVKAINKVKSNDERKESFNNFVLTVAYEKAKKILK